MSGLTHNVSAQANELLDHIYEYGTNSEGVTGALPHRSGSNERTTMTDAAKKEGK